MLLPQEVAAKITIPALRALVAKKLIEKHGMSQRRAAKLLGITQAAVSNYVRSTRAAGFNIEEVDEVNQFSEEIADMLAQGADTISVMFRFAEACNHILESRLMCGFHSQIEPDLDVETCHLCDQHGPEPLIPLKGLGKR